ncbi:MAG: polysulfide reductase NrfD [Nitrospirae bacterium]|nr:polysulfide reductase NrfD [Nitrospirota bacterium]MCL5238228.1 polysulfide reductase NrfD [Nitrospirota bacterium]
MIKIERQFIFQQEWTGKGERGIRDFLLIPAIFFGAICPGLFISSLVSNYVPGYWAALALNFGGYGITHLLFLGKMERFWRAVLNVRTSWISRGFVFNAMFSLFGLLYALAETAPLPVLSDPAVKTLLKLMSAVSAVLFAAYPGFMLSIVKAIPFWRSLLEPVLFFLQGVMGGLALQLLLMSFMPMPGYAGDIVIKANFVILQVVLLLFMSALIIKAMHGGAEKTSVAFLTTGNFSRVFLGGALVTGLVAPLFILTAGILLPLDFDAYSYIYYLAMIAELAGIYAGKYSVLRAGAYSPLR